MTSLGLFLIIMFGGITTIFINLLTWEHCKQAWLKYLTTIISILLFSGLTTWFFYSNSQDWQVEKVNYYEIQNIDNYQIVNINEEPLNITKIFGRTYNPNLYHVSKTEWKMKYYGITYVGIELPKSIMWRRNN